jgi:serine/threonine protein kinase
VTLPARLDAALAGRYRVTRELGRGGMAVVYLADDLRHERQVAVKVILPEVAQVLGAERFSREITIAARLNHPHILPLYDSGGADGLLFYVMPWVKGESLREKLRREGQLQVEDAVRIVCHAAGRSTTRTRKVSCTATSSPRTSSCTRARRWWPTSASPSLPPSGRAIASPRRASRWGRRAT